MQSTVYEHNEKDTQVIVWTPTQLGLAASLSFRHHEKREKEVTKAYYN